MAEDSDKSQTLDQIPIITYINRLQKQMFIITELLYNHSNGLDTNLLKSSLRGLIDILPPPGQEELKIAYGQLQSKRYVSTLELEAIFRKTHNWAYNKIFKEAFKARPLNPHPDHIGDTH